jgi:hypothetical protein
MELIADANRDRGWAEKAVLVRPALLSETAANSPPSGHVAAVAGLAVAAVLVVPGSLRKTVAALGSVAVGPTGLATVALRWHRPSDVLAERQSPASRFRHHGAKAPGPHGMPRNRRP